MSLNDETFSSIDEFNSSNDERLDVNCFGCETDCLVPSSQFTVLSSQRSVICSSNALHNSGYRYNRSTSLSGERGKNTINGSIKTEPMARVVSVSEMKFLVNTDACKIMNVNPFDDSIKHLLKQPEPIICENEKLFTYINVNVLYVNTSTKPKGLNYCHVKPIFYKEKNSFIFGKESDKFVSSIPIKDEFIKVECFNSFNSIIGENFYINFVPKITTRENSRNDTLSSSPVSDHRLNILLIVIDSTSRANSLRYMPKTRRLLSETLGAVEMLGYNKLADNTRVNLVPLLTGRYENGQSCFMDKQGIDRCPFIWKNFSRKGYATHYAEDWSSRSIFHYRRSGFKQQPTDYYDYPFHLSKEHCEKSATGNCFQGRLSSDVFFDRIYNLALNLKQTPYFSMSIVKQLTHANLSGLAHIDNSVMNTLLKLYENNLLNNTFLALFGDHGLRYGDVRQTLIGHLEDRLPLMFIYVPAWFKMKHETYLRNLNTNTRRLMTLFDMHATLQHLLELDRENYTQKYGKGISLFTEIPDWRSCKDARILPHWCTCNYQLISITKSRVSYTMAIVLVKHINKLLKKFKAKCETLRLLKMHSSFKLPPYFSYVELFRILITTIPGDAVFESTLVYKPKYRKFSVVGIVSRLNSYKGQSNCVNVTRIEKFCYCKK